MRFDYLRKLVMLCGAALCVSIVSVPHLKAATATTTSTSGTSSTTDPDAALLQQIANNTSGILTQVSNLQNVLTNIGLLVTAWVTNDTSPASATMASNFNLMDQQLLNDMNKQISLQSQLNTYSANNLGITQSNFNRFNDLVYSSVLNQPAWNPDPRGAKVTAKQNALNYIIYGSGLNIYHVVPDPTWQGQEINKDRYKNYFNAVMAAESFNGFVLSNQYVDMNQLNTIQQSLISQAMDPQAWFAQVASEDIGWVLRQILIYQSQAYILTSQMLQTEKQVATALALTNTILIAANQLQESTMVSKAQNVRPTS